MQLYKPKILKNMKKQILSIVLVALAAASATLISSCGKDDTAPIITLIGDNPTVISLNIGTYTELGATASDDEDGDVTANISISGTVNKDLAGSYTITYTVSDQEGNEATETREVIVKNDADYLTGSFHTVEGSQQWDQTISSSTTENNKIKFSYFAFFTGNDEITAKLIKVGSDTYVVINPAAQTANGIGGTGCNHVFAQDVTNGTKVAQSGGGKWGFSIKFTDQITGPGGPNCGATSAQSYEDVFTQN